MAGSGGPRAGDFISIYNVRPVQDLCLTNYARGPVPLTTFIIRPNFAVSDIMELTELVEKERRRPFWRFTILNEARYQEMLDSVRHWIRETGLLSQKIDEVESLERVLVRNRAILNYWRSSPEGPERTQNIDEGQDLVAETIRLRYIAGNDLSRLEIILGRPSPSPSWSSSSSPSPASSPSPPPTDLVPPSSLPPTNR